MRIQLEEVGLTKCSLFCFQFCVSAISQTECVAPLKRCMEHNRDCIEKSCETLSRLFKHQHVS